MLSTYKSKIADSDISIVFRDSTFEDDVAKTKYEPEPSRWINFKVRRQDDA